MAGELPKVVYPGSKRQEREREGGYDCDDDTNLCQQTEG